MRYSLIEYSPKGCCCKLRARESSQWAEIQSRENKDDLVKKDKGERQNYQAAQGGIER